MTAVIQTVGSVMYIRPMATQIAGHSHIPYTTPICTTPISNEPGTSKDNPYSLAFCFCFFLNLYEALDKTCFDVLVSLISLRPLYQPDKRRKVE